MSILISKEWRSIEMRHPLVEKELKLLRAAISSLEPKPIELPKLSAKEALEQSNKTHDEKNEILVRPRIVMPFQKQDAKIIWCSIHLNCRDTAYNYRDENGEIVAIRFAKTGVVANLIEPQYKRKLWLISPCCYCGIIDASACPHPAPTGREQFGGSYPFIGHHSNIEV